MNLVEKLKDAPIGTKLYSPIYGVVKFLGVNGGDRYPIRVQNILQEVVTFNTEGQYYAKFAESECMLFPSKENHDWSTFKVKPKPEHIFKPFKKVLVRDSTNGRWTCDWFSYMDNENEYYVCTHGYRYKYCIPYKGNEHLVGTIEEK